MYDLRNFVEPKGLLKGHANNPINAIEFARFKMEKPTISQPSGATVTTNVKDQPKGSAYPKETRASEMYSPVDQPAAGAKTKWKSIEDIREEAKRNVELRKKYKNIRYQLNIEDCLRQNLPNHRAEPAKVT